MSSLLKKFGGRSISRDSKQRRNCSANRSLNLRKSLGRDPIKSLKASKPKLRNSLLTSTPMRLKSQRWYLGKSSNRLEAYATKFSKQLKGELKRKEKSAIRGMG